MSVIMNPVMSFPGPEMSTKRVESGRETESSFAGHLDRQLDEKYRSNSDKLGVDDRNAVKAKANTAEERSDAPVKKTGETDAAKESKQDESLVDLLAEFMAELQEVAEKNTGLPGEWNVELPDLDALKQLAIDAGMDEAEISRFMQQFDSEDNKVSLVDFFAALNEYFDAADENVPVSVPETELPMLDALLAKMGVSRQSLDQLSQQAVNGEGKLDLAKFLQGLQALESGDADKLSPIVLTDLEAEQLQSILAQAGMTLEKQNELLPERFLNQVLGQTDENGQSVELSLERLQNILKEGIATVNENQAALDAPAFLTDLQKIVSQSTYESQSVGFTPVVQETVTAVFQKLQEMVDLAKVKLEENKFMEERFATADYAKWVQALDEKFAQGDMGSQGDSAEFSQFNLAQHGEEAALLQTEAGAILSTEPDVTSTSATVTTTSTAAVTEAGSENTPVQDASRAHAAAASIRASRQQQQQVVQQLSAGVMRGLKSQEHHLVLRLYPQDLGEVKVNLTVQNEHVSVSFNMENSKVKEMLESNMQEFKDSMNQKGFTLGDCFVSSGEQEDSGELWQRFEMARKTIEAARETVADLPEETLYHQASAGSMAGHEDGISLVV